MNLVEIWFGIVERQAIHRGTFGNVRDLTTAIRTYINGWNNRAHPFVWTKTADKSSRKPTAKPLQTRATSLLTLNCLVSKLTSASASTRRMSSFPDLFRETLRIRRSDALS